MLKKDATYQVTVTFRDPLGITDGSDVEILIENTLEDAEFDVVEITSVKEITE